VTSNDRSERLDLDRGLPTDERDVRALRALRYPRMDDVAYVRFLAALEPSDPAVLARKRGPRGDPFRLP
jgi:hypothetical protein